MEVKVNCPYCGAKNKINHHYPWDKDYLNTCEKCMAVFITRVNVEITAHAKKVEGEG